VYTYIYTYIYIYVYSLHEWHESFFLVVWIAYTRTYGRVLQWWCIVLLLCCSVLQSSIVATCCKVTWLVCTCQCCRVTRQPVLELFVTPQRITLKRTATHCNTLWHTAATLQHTAACAQARYDALMHCWAFETLQHTARILQHTASHWNILQPYFNTATHYMQVLTSLMCNHTATHCNNTAIHYKTLQHTATTATHCMQVPKHTHAVATVADVWLHCNTLQHYCNNTATTQQHCNNTATTLQQHCNNTATTLQHTHAVATIADVWWGQTAAATLLIQGQSVDVGFRLHWQLLVRLNPIPNPYA